MNETRPAEVKGTIEDRGHWFSPLTPMALVFVVLTMAVMLIVSCLQPLNTDETGVMVMDSVSSFARLIQLQRTAPIMLEPVVCHLLERMSLICFGHNAFSLRLPSLLGCLAFEVCLFLFVSKARGSRAATLALGLFALGGPLVYAGEGRPYGVLLGFAGLAAASWQAATRADAATGRQPVKLLLLLCVSLALAVNTHYYAVLLLLPVYGAEIYRSIQKRHIDVPVQLALAGGVAGLAFVLPFMKAASQFKGGSYTRFVPDPHSITHSYLWLVAGGVPAGQSLQRVLLLCAVLLAGAGFWGSRRKLHEGSAPPPQAEMIYLALLAALPLFGYFVAREQSVMFQARYVVCAGFGVDAVLAIGLSGMFYKRTTYTFGVAVLFTLALGGGFGQIAEHANARSNLTALIAVPPQTRTALRSFANQPIYILNSVDFLEVEHYSPDPEARSRLVLVYSFAQEMRVWNTEFTSLETSHLKSWSNFDVQSYEQIKTQPGEHLFVLSPATWLDSALALDHASIERLGPAYGGELVSVRFPPPAPGDPVAR
jgi:hypothetical protein